MSDRERDEARRDGAEPRGGISPLIIVVGVLLLCGGLGGGGVVALMVYGWVTKERELQREMTESQMAAEQAHLRQVELLERERREAELDAQKKAVREREAKNFVTLSGFRRVDRDTGTPKLQLDYEFDASANRFATYKLVVKTKDGEAKVGFGFPVKVGKTETMVLEKVLGPQDIRNGKIEAWVEREEKGKSERVSNVVRLLF